MFTRISPIAALLGVSVSFPPLLVMHFLIACERTPPPAETVPVAVRVAPVAATDGARDLYLSGTMSAERSVTLSFNTVGTVEQVMVQEGQAVQQGDTLATLVQQTYREALGIAKAKSEQAEDAYRRFLPMHRNGTIPEVRMVEVQTAREAARRSLSIAGKNLDDTILRASVPGIIARRDVEPGTSAAPALPAFTVVQTRTMLATAPVPEREVARVSRGMPARVTVPALGKSFEGVLSELGVTADPLTRTYEVRVPVPNPEGKLRIGMIADVCLHFPGQTRSLVVPPAAVRLDEHSRPYVFVVGRDSSVQRRKVNVAGFAGEQTALEGDLREGELVITSGTPMLSSGMTVRIVESEAGTGR